MSSAQLQKQLFEHGKQCVREAIDSVAQEIHAVISREGVEAHEIKSNAQIEGIIVRVVAAFSDRFGTCKTMAQLAARQGAISAICENGQTVAFMVVEAVASLFMQADREAAAATADT